MNAILQPGEIELPKNDIPFMRLPVSGEVFAQRARRLSALARDHVHGDYLAFMARLSLAQEVVLDTFPPVPLPSAEQLALFRRYGMPPLNVQSWTRDWAWQAGLKQIFALLGNEPLSPQAKQAVAHLSRVGVVELEHLAEAVLAGAYSIVPPETAPFIGAALQVYWTHMATMLGEQAFGRIEQANLCPVCGSLPVSGLVRGGGEAHGLRYLSCSLCATEWHMVRIKCSSCASTRDIGYYSQEGSSGAVKAESCDDCNGYLKIMYMEKDSEVEPVADDLATLGLDLLMNQAGKERSGPNLFFHPGNAS